MKSAPVKSLNSKKMCQQDLRLAENKEQLYIDKYITNL